MILNDDLYLSGHIDDEYDNTWTFNWGLQGGMTFTGKADIIEALGVMEKKYGYYFEAIKVAKAKHIKARAAMEAGEKLNRAEIEKKIAELKASLEYLD